MPDHRDPRPPAPPPAGPPPGRLRNGPPEAQGPRRARPPAPLAPSGGPAGAGPADRRAAPDALVLRALGLGDFLAAVPALRALQRALPGHRLHLAAPAAQRALLDLAGLAWPVAPTDPLRPPAWSGPRPPELAVNLHGSGPQSVRTLQALAPARLWTHAHPDLPGVPGPTWDADLHETDRWCRLLHHHGVPADPADLRLDPPPTPSPRPGAAVLHPGAAAPARRWPPDRFAAAARHLTARGHRVVVTGGPGERALAERVARDAGLPGDDVLAGRTPLPVLAALIADAALVLCGDTGVAHLATAYGTPSVRLFGPVPPALWGPRTDHDRHVCLWAGTTGDPHADRPDPGLLRVTTEAVLDALDALGTLPAAPRAAADPR
ncbi:glycosyltransferase family 9 protein [Nocardiopsis trehalosi]|uniref:glycosyltransferase family 9 protein n=1 Tax=Nocardiopsis trehalosi TaxID=109329 RepID=UPI0009FE34E5|nr:glycosyltransferase family 9 protein [Nocardiopsis trehalosi]